MSNCSAGGGMTQLFSLETLTIKYLKGVAVPESRNAGGFSRTAVLPR
jgi:hypothetical protein